MRKNGNARVTTIGNASKYIVESFKNVLQKRDDEYDSRVNGSDDRLDGRLMAFLRFLLIGAPGVGKTALVRTLESVLQAFVRTLRHIDSINIVVFSTQVMKPEGIGGYPAMVNGEAFHVPFGNMKRLIQADERNLVICLFEDLGQAMPSVKSACMQVMDGWVNDHRIDTASVIFMANTNDTCHDANVKSMIDPLLTRFTCALRVTHDTRFWLNDIAPGIGIHPMVSAYVGHMLQNQSTDVLNDEETSSGFDKRCSPRTWHQMSDCLHAGMPSDFGIDGEDLSVIESVIGHKESSNFYGFLKIAPKAVNPRKVLADPLGVSLPDDMNVLYMVCSGCAEIVDRDTANEFILFVDRLPRQLQSFTVKQAVNRDFSLASCDSFYEWRFRPENKALMIG